MGDEHGPDAGAVDRRGYRCRDRRCDGWNVLMCENVLAWRDTFRLEDLTYARNQVDDFEAYRSGGVFASGTAWAALVVVLIAIVLATVAGVRAGR